MRSILRGICACFTIALLPTATADDSALDQASETAGDVVQELLELTKGPCWQSTWKVSFLSNMTQVQGVAGFWTHDLYKAYGKFHFSTKDEAAGKYWWIIDQGIALKWEDCQQVSVLPCYLVECQWEGLPPP